MGQTTGSQDICVQKLVLQRPASYLTLSDNNMKNVVFAVAKREFWHVTLYSQNVHVRYEHHVACRNCIFLYYNGHFEILVMLMM